jgi:hypothetical protein
LDDRECDDGMAREILVPELEDRSAAILTADYTDYTDGKKGETILT